MLYRNDGVIYRDNTNTQTGQSTFTEGDIMAMSYDVSSGTVTFYKNNSVVTTETVTDTDNVQYFGCTSDNTGGGAYYHWNFGADSSFQGLETAGGNADGNGIGDFYYAPPSGFLALCTANLPEPTIGANSLTQADDHFSAYIYTGDTNANRTISGIGFKPDWTWIKNRGQANNHDLFDSSRSGGLALYTNSTLGDQDESAFFGGFAVDGFVLNSNGGQTNLNGNTYVAWNWKANASVTVSHSAGDNSATEASVSQANTDAGFSIVTYTGDTTGHGSTYPSTFNHGLGLRPKMIIVKARNSTQSWAVYHDDMNGTSSYNHAMFLDLANGKSSASNAYWGANTMTLNTNLFSVGSDNTTGANGVNYVAYCFAEVEGYSKFGSYTGNNSNDGTFVYLGFRPAYVMIKSTGVESWYIWDSTRETENSVHQYLMANSANTEDTTSYTQIVDFVSNGFKLREDYWSGNGISYIYMAFAEESMKYSNGR